VAGAHESWTHETSHLLNGLEVMSRPLIAVNHLIWRFDLNFPTTRVSNSPSMIVRSASPFLLAFTAVIASCSKPAVESYRVPKETAVATPPAAVETAPRGKAETKAPTPGAGANPTPAGSAMASTAVPTSSGPGLTWTAPPHWKSTPASAMRKGSFTITGDGGEADLSITAFPGDVGGELANLNRWRGQPGIELPPISQAELESNTQHLDRNDLHMTVVDIAGTGPNAKRTLGAMIPHAGSTWFVKLMGPDALVAKEKPAFMAFLDTIKPAPAAR
jgi:hypothetical protein